MSTLERNVYKRWKTGANQLYFGRCDHCNRDRDEHTGHLLLVARQPRRRQRECFDCYVARTEP